MAKAVAFIFLSLVSDSPAQQGPTAETGSVCDSVPRESVRFPSQSVIGEIKFGEHRADEGVADSMDHNGTLGNAAVSHWYGHYELHSQMDGPHDPRQFHGLPIGQPMEALEPQHQGLRSMSPEILV